MKHSAVRRTEKTEKMGVYTLHQHMHVRDSMDKRAREARIVDFKKNKNTIKIHYREWNDKHDEW